MIVRTEINNMAEYAKGRDGYIVARRDENAKLWFYGFFDTAKKAQEVAIEIGNGVVLGVTQ